MTGIARRRQRLGYRSLGEDSSLGSKCASVCRTDVRNVTSYYRVVKSFVDASGPLGAGELFSGPTV
jgi:hypothetical protein